MLSQEVLSKSSPASPTIEPNTLRILLEGIESARIIYTPAVGLYAGDVEPALGLSIDFREGDREAVLAALARFSLNFNQEQLHVRGTAQPRTSLGHEYGDGSFNTYVIRFTLKNPISKAEVQKVIDASGLPGLTVTDEYLETYYVGDASDGQAINEFKAAAGRARASLGNRSSGFEEGAGRLWAYGTGFGATNSYGEIERDIRPARGDRQVRTAQRVASRLAGREVSGTTQAPTVTEDKAALRRRIAEAYDALRLDALDDPIVRRAYEELAAELVQQFDALPIKVEIFNGKGQPYQDSRGRVSSMISDPWYNP